MTEKFVVFNPGQGSVSFTLYPKVDLPDEMSRHKKRRLLRSSAIPVVVTKQSSVDLVELTGMSVADLKEQPELLHMLHSRVPKLFEKKDSEEKPKKAEKKAASPEPEPETEPAPKEEPEPPKEKKSKKTRKTRKK